MEEDINIEMHIMLIDQNINMDKTATHPKEIEDLIFLYKNPN